MHKRMSKRVQSSSGSRASEKVLSASPWPAAKVCAAGPGAGHIIISASSRPTSRVCSGRSGRRISQPAGRYSLAHSVWKSTRTNRGSRTATGPGECRSSGRRVSSASTRQGVIVCNGTDGKTEQFNCKSEPGANNVHKVGS